MGCTVTGRIVGSSEEINAIEESVGRRIVVLVLVLVLQVRAIHADIGG